MILGEEVLPGPFACFRGAFIGNWAICSAVGAEGSFADKTARSIVLVEASANAKGMVVVIDWFRKL